VACGLVTCWGTILSKIFATHCNQTATLNE
jgi:hypothetical protein